MKTFKRYSAAQKAANGKLIVHIADLYLVPETDDEAKTFTEVSLIGPGGSITSHISLGHLDRLGNANWAEPPKTAHGRNVNRKRVWPDFQPDRAA